MLNFLCDFPILESNIRCLQTYNLYSQLFEQNLQSQIITLTFSSKSPDFILQNQNLSANFVSMKDGQKNISVESTILLTQFNSREESAFTAIYNLYYYEFFHFANRLFCDTVEYSEDVVQEVFINIWNNKAQNFDSLNGLKLYIYVCIKNRFRDYVKHKKHEEKYRKIVLSEDYFTIQIAESEVYSILAESLHHLPDECAAVFRLHLDGWEVKEIAQQLGKTESTVYKQKSRAIEILKNKLSGDPLSILLIMLS